MVANSPPPDGMDAHTRETIAYIRQILGELRQVARREGAEMLCYLIDMAYVEACDVQAGKRSLSIRHGDGDEPARVPV